MRLADEFGTLPFSSYFFSFIYLYIYNQVPSKLGSICQGITHSTTITAAEYESHLKFTTDIPYLDLTGELWGLEILEQIL